MVELAVSSAKQLTITPAQALIARANTAVTAFVGRALKGPVNRPIAIRSFDQYQRVFGGLWQPSTLSYAVEQYFEHGGRECIVVRVCNGGGAPTLTLPVASGFGAPALRLTGIAPGSREFLRVSVDYDGIAAHETDRFNLVVQRLRTAGSESIEEQESFRRISIRSAGERSVTDVLGDSRLVRVLGELPPARPARSGGRYGAAGYICSDAAGDDGDALTYYDIIGNAQTGTGLFALRGAELFNFLYIPPLTRELDVGLPALLVALRLCRERQAMLLVDPPAAWSDAESAIAALRNWPLFSEDALMFYPRLRTLDRLRGHEEVYGCAAAAAGLMAAATERCPVWSAAGLDDVQLRPSVKPAAAITDLDHVRLAQGGVNVLQPARMSLSLPRLGLRTLVPQAGTKSEGRYLSARRFTLFVMASIERGTRWGALEHSGPALWGRLRSQVLTFFRALEEEGAFMGTRPEENYFVVCDERINGPEAAARGALRLLFGFALSRPGEFHSCLVEHRPNASSVRPVSVNRYALPEGV